MGTVFKRYFWVLYLIGSGALALVGADIVNGIVHQKLRLPPETIQRKTDKTTSKEERRDPSRYAVIYERDMFHSAKERVAGAGKKGPGKSITAVIKEGDLEKTPLQVRLRGTVYRDKGNSIAIIEDVKTRKQDLYHVGDMILGEAKLIAVSRNKVYLERNGKQEVLEVYEKAEEKPGGRSAGTPPVRRPIPTGTGIRRLSGDQYRIPREDLQGAFENMNQLLTQVRVVPNFKDGAPDGFKLLSIKRGSIIHQAGLRDGDIVKRVNGIEIDSPEKAFEVYEQVKNEPLITVEVIRGASRKTFRYDVR
jgi:general secretion pathway protein C